MAAPMNVDVCQDDEDKRDISDMFKESFKFYKRRKPPPDFSKVINFSCGDCGSSSKILPYQLSASDHNILEVKPVQQWKAYTLQHVPGFIFICNPFTAAGQRYWVERCLRHYHCKPYVTNLDKHCTVTGNLWEDHRRPVESATEGSTKKTDKPLMDKLRWATLGYHHDWDTKHYRADHRCAMPEDMVLLCRHIAAAAGYPHYDPQASIVNYYHMDSTLAGHTDHSEFDLEAPLISVSFGQPAIFLLGGPSKSQRPHAMHLHSGDIVIMMKESRLTYHAVPRIVQDKNGLPKALCTDEKETNTDGQDCGHGFYKTCQKMDSKTEKTGTDMNKDNYQKVQCNKQESEYNTNEGNITVKTDAEHSSGNNKTSPNAEQCGGTCKNETDSERSTASLTCDSENTLSFIDTAAPATDRTRERLVNEHIASRIQNMDWTEYEDYMKTCRLNLNVRQVLSPGKSFPSDIVQYESCKKSKVS